MKYISFLLFLFISFNNLFSEGVELENNILKNDKNKYHIVTKIHGQDNPGVMRLTFTIPDEYTFKFIFYAPKK